MDPQRELRYYASIPKILLVSLGAGGFALVGWWLLGAGIGANLVIGFLSLVFGGFGTLILFAWLVLMLFARKPLLRINASGITSTPPLMVWKSAFVPWEDAARIGIRIQYLSSKRSFFQQTYYHFVVDTRNHDSQDTSKVRNLTVRMYPSLADATIMVPLNWIFFISWRRRRTRLLERVETNFASEIVQYNVVIDKVEQPI